MKNSKYFARIFIGLFLVLSLAVSGFSIKSIVNAEEPTLLSIAFEQDQYSVTTGQTVQTTVNAVYSDASSVNVTSQCTITASDSGIASVDSSGLVTGVSIGQAEITSTYQGFSANTTIEVINQEPTPTPTPTPTPEITLNEITLDSSSYVSV